MSDRCKSCNAPIVWAKTAEGKPMPLDPIPKTGGNIIVVDGVAKVVPVQNVGEAFVSHFATCPDSNKHRKKKPESKEQTQMTPSEPKAKMAMEPITPDTEVDRSWSATQANGGHVPTGPVALATPAKQKRGLDVELQTMAKMDRLLADISTSDGAVDRVLTWLNGKWMTTRYDLEEV